MKRKWRRAAAAGAGVGVLAALLLSGGQRPPETGERYRLSDYAGRVAVYGPGAGAQPREITSIRVQLLPAADRAMLREGIGAADERALAMLLEDLGS